MNAPISAALFQLRAGQVPQPLATGAKPLRAVLVVAQPLVPTTAQLLYTGYEHDGLYLDLYGLRAPAGHDVQHAHYTGDDRRVDVAVTYKREVLRQMSDWCDRKLPSAYDLKLVSQQEARAERVQWERGFGLSPP